MTTKGCQECPSEEEIAPIRNTALAVGLSVLSIFWFWYSWSPFFPSVGALMNKIVLLLYGKTTEASEKASRISDFVSKCVLVIHKLKLPQYFKIFVSYLQVMSSFMGFHVAWPSSILNAMMWCKATLNFSVLSLPGVSCLWRDLDYNTKLMTYTVIPLAFSFMLLGPVLLILMLRLLTSNRNSEYQALFEKTSSLVYDRFWNALMFMIFLVGYI